MSNEFSVPHRKPTKPGAIQGSAAPATRNAAPNYSQPSIVERIRQRINDAPMPIEQLLDDAADRIEALEGALRQMAKDPPPNLDEPDLDFEVIEKMRAIARAALSSQEAGK